MSCGFQSGIHFALEPDWAYIYGWAFIQVFTVTEEHQNKQKFITNRMISMFLINQELK